ncbi:hypothetical protein QJS10_CPB19g01371 [Acorus calamus]|uniref:Uncharacterized protein n=1 Tax=Acorus calamus TaxID=4465 RepID=A0AAV9CGT9_ACOCL|nr:hypothetical protein QJS10_CPB19g01371 [Acorus calamus]
MHKGRDVLRLSSRVADLRRASKPLFQVLRLVDAHENPAIAYLYFAIETTKERIMDTFGHKVGQYGPILNIVNKRWDSQIHQPLHSTFFFSTLVFISPLRRKEQNFAKFEGAFLDALERLFPMGDVPQWVCNAMDVAEYGPPSQWSSHPRSVTSHLKAEEGQLKRKGIHRALMGDMCRPWTNHISRSLLTGLTQGGVRNQSFRERSMIEDKCPAQLSKERS